jgi:hypothetical protein
LHRQRGQRTADIEQHGKRHSAFVICVVDFLPFKVERGGGRPAAATAYKGYTTQSGTYVQPHQQTNSNNTQLDNYGTRGNVNPYTGAVGTRGARY